MLAGTAVRNSLIVGGGLAGLSAALSLARQGQCGRQACKATPDDQRITDGSASQHVQCPRPIPVYQSLTGS